MRRLVTVLVSAVGIWSAACSSYDDVPPSTVAKLDAVPNDCKAIKGFNFVEQNLLSKCGGSACHDPGNDKSVVVLSAGVAYQNMVGVTSTEQPRMQLIEPGKPSRSFMFRKITGTQGTACEDDRLFATICGKPMPLNDWFELPAELVEETRAWIACGAPTATGGPAPAPAPAPAR